MVDEESHVLHTKIHYLVKDKNGIATVLGGGIPRPRHKIHFFLQKHEWNSDEFGLTSAIERKE